MIIQPAKKLYGNLRLPGDKSISHRAAMFSAIARGETEIRNFASSADCAATVKCLQNLCVEISVANSIVKVKGAGKNGLRASETALDCENSGTTVRLLGGILAGQNFVSTLIGDESLSKRPMRRIIEPLTKMGAQIEAARNCLPMTICGQKPLAAINYELPVNSAQVKSCILLAGLFADGQTTVRHQKSAMRDHTERMLRWFGVELEENFIETDDGVLHETTIDSGAELISPGVLSVPSDISSAAFFLVAAACLPGSEIKIENVGLNPTRAEIVKVLHGCGVSIEIAQSREVCGEPVGDLIVTGAPNLAVEKAETNVLRGGTIAGLIDELPILAVFGTQLENGLEIRDAAELRVKESDRIAATVQNLRLMNAEVEEFADGLCVRKSRLKAARVESHGDHRIAMAFSIAGLLAAGETEIIGADCVKVSFPEFFERLEELTAK